MWPHLVKRGAIAGSKPRTNKSKKWPMIFRVLMCLGHARKQRLRCSFLSDHQQSRLATTKNMLFPTGTDVPRPSQQAMTDQECHIMPAILCHDAVHQKQKTKNQHIHGKIAGWKHEIKQHYSQCFSSSIQSLRSFPLQRIAAAWRLFLLPVVMICSEVNRLLRIPSDQRVSNPAAKSRWHLGFKIPCSGGPTVLKEFIDQTSSQNLRMAGTFAAWS